MIGNLANIIAVATAGTVDWDSGEITFATKTIPNYTFSGCNALEKVYYLGTAEEWKKVKVTGNADFIAVARYYYSEQTPSDTQNKYWRFASDGKSIVEW